MAALMAWLLNTWRPHIPLQTSPPGHAALVATTIQLRCGLRRQTVATSELVAAPRQEVKVDPEAVAYEFYDWRMAVYGWLAGLAEQATPGCSKEN